MKSAKQQQDVRDVAAAATEAALRSGWRVCGRCGELALPPGRNPTCVSCPLSIVLIHPERRANEHRNRKA